MDCRDHPWVGRRAAVGPGGGGRLSSAPALPDDDLAQDKLPTEPRTLLAVAPQHPRRRTARATVGTSGLFFVGDPVGVL